MINRSCHCLFCHGIVDEDILFKLSDDHVIHKDCLKCFKCCEDLSEYHSCYYYKGMVLCAHDYYRSRTNYCDVCHQVIYSGQNYVQLPIKHKSDNMKYYHENCMTCACCKCNLLENEHEQLFTTNLNVFCTTCFIILEGLSFNKNIESEESHSQCRNTNEFNTIEKEVIYRNHSDNKVCTSFYSKSPNCITKKSRNRTTFTYEQIQRLGMYFAIDPRPSTTQKQIIADRTGLTVKNVRVWFQNRRFQTVLSLTELTEHGLRLTSQGNSVAITMGRYNEHTS
ncbi:hypothetical protein GJ496_005575 [Pomphorhynchus laevis]|nr:hypothetical protein GJ496_001349 [Pomphorhynchus laevis]KAI0983180.1 hypothetical protein GJ496_005575 [Pomphorhynchus laevis]